MTLAEPLNTNALFEPVQIGKLRLRNRIAMSPMTREFADNGVLPPESAGYYASRAAGGTGLIITEATTIDHEVAHYSTREPYMFGEAALDSWRRVVDAVHAQGGAIFPQLWHTGINRKRSKVHNPDTPSIGPSDISSADLAKADGESLPSIRSGVPPRPATQADIDSIVAAFGLAAVEAQRVGCDGIAIHGAHGYLLYQFYWERSNRREDGYGGSFDNRARLAIEVVREIRRRVGPDFPIMFRFSQWAGWDYSAKLAQDPGELERLLLPLADAGVDIFDASTRRFWLPEFDGSDMNLAGWAHKITGKPTMTVGSVGLESPLGDPGTLTGVTTENLRRLMEMVERGDFQIVGVGRALLANPDWADLVREGRWDALRPYDAARIVEAL
ncbi:MAG: 12-oxophytodienoate reductase [Sphingobium sp.]